MPAASGIGPTCAGAPAPCVLPNGVTAGDKRNRLFVVHRHSRKSLADISAAAIGSGFPLGPSGFT